MNIGIYMIKNKINGKAYIGQAKNLKLRINNHKNRLRRSDKHCNKHLLEAWKCYGEDNFQFSIIEEYDSYDINLLNERETYWTKYYKSDNREFGYNVREPGSRGNNSKETKKLIGDANRGKKRTSEAKDKIRKANIGEKSNSAKLNNFTVLEIVDCIKLNQYTNRQLAIKFNISLSTIKNIKRGKGWNWLTRIKENKEV